MIAMAEIVLIDLEKIKPSKRQSRTTFDQDRLLELANSIKEQGVLQPILVRRIGRDGYEVIAGERRFRASKIAGLKKIPAIVRDSDDTGLMIDSFLENAQREDLTPSEKEDALIALWNTGKFPTPKELDRALGYTTGYSSSIIEAREFREKYNIPSSVTTTSIVSTKGLTNDLRRRIILRVTKDEGRFGQVRTVRELKAIAEKAPKAILDQVLEDRIPIQDAQRAVDLYDETLKRENLRPFASAIAEGLITPSSAEKTLRLYSDLEKKGIALDPEIVAEDIQEVKRQNALDSIHDKLMQEARTAVLTGRKKAIDLKVFDPGDSFVREVRDVAWNVLKWGVPSLMEVGAERWKIATEYFRQIDTKMHSLLGYGHAREAGDS